MEIFLARHGETDWNKNGRLMGQKDIPLNEAGISQAKKLKAKLSDIDFDCCYSSPLARAKETAEIICESKCPVLCDDNLKERFGGELEGTVVDNWGDYIANTTTEPDAEILKRAKNFLEMLKNTNHRRVLIVSHNGLLKNLRHCILGSSGPVDFSQHNLQNCEVEKYEI